MDDSDLITEIIGRAGGGVNAHSAHSAAEQLAVPMGSALERDANRSKPFHVK